MTIRLPMTSLKKKGFRVVWAIFMAIWRGLKVTKQDFHDYSYILLVLRVNAIKYDLTHREQQTSIPQLSLMLIGIPCNGPLAAPRFASSSSACGCQKYLSIIHDHVSQEPLSYLYLKLNNSHNMFIYKELHTWN